MLTDSIYRAFATQGLTTGRGCLKARQASTHHQHHPPHATSKTTRPSASSPPSNTPHGTHYLPRAAWARRRTPRRQDRGAGPGPWACSAALSGQNRPPRAAAIPMPPLKPAGRNGTPPADAAQEGEQVSKSIEVTCGRFCCLALSAGDGFDRPNCILRGIAVLAHASDMR